MKKISKILILVLSLILIFAVGACAVEDTSSGSSLQSQTTSSQVSQSSQSSQQSGVEIEYTISIDSEIVGGSVGASLDKAYNGTQITLTNTAEEGYRFVKYIVKMGETEIPVTNGIFILPESNVLVSAVFEKISYTITINQVSNGTISASKLTAVMGEEITLSSEAEKGYSLGAYSVKQGNAIISVINDKFTMPAGDVTITATFTKQSCTVTIGVNTSGYGSVSTTSIQVPYGASVSVSGSTLTIGNETITASATAQTAEYTYAFSGWTNASGSVTAEKTITANFTRSTRSYTITISVNTSGYGSVSKTSVSAEYGASISASGSTLTIGSNTIVASATAQTEQYTYAFSSWTGASGTVTGAKTITANFTRTTRSYAVTIAVKESGYGTVSKTSVTVNYGTSISSSGSTLTIGSNTITASATAQTAQYSYAFSSWTGASGTVTGAKTVTANFTRTTRSYTVTLTQATGGTIKVNNATTASRSVNYGTTITLSHSASAGYIFSSYKVNGTAQTSTSYTVTGATTVTGTFNKGIAGLSNYNFSGKLNDNNGATTTGSVTYSNNSISCTQDRYPYVYSQLQGDFYFEIEIAFSSSKLYNGDAYTKAGIAIECNNEILYFYIDALANGYNNGGFGNNTWVVCTPGAGVLGSSSEMCWADREGYKFNFNKNYGSGAYIKLGVMRVEGLYRFFANEKYAFSVWSPNMNDTARLGILSYNMGFEAKNAKYGVGSTVLQNTRAYYGLTSNNPTNATIDGNINDWGENIVNQYGMATYDSRKYYFASAFKGSDGVYVVYRARTSNYITNGANWWDNTNIEMHSTIGQIYANAAGTKQHITDLSFTQYKESKTQDYIITVEAKIPYSVWGGTNNSTTIKLAFAFKSNDPAQLNFSNDDAAWWCGMNWGQKTINTTGISLTRETTPTEKVIKTTMTCADPFIMLVGDTYYLYGTTAAGNGYKVYLSSDLKTWRAPTASDFSAAGITPNTEQSSGYCFHKNWSKAVGTTDFWAAEVKYNTTTKKYVMFYSSGRYFGDVKVPKSGVAISDSPLGPFIDANNGTPMIYPTENNKASIDATCFVDTDGQAYMFYSLDCSHNVIENYYNGITCHVSQTWGVKLDSTWTKISGTPVLISTPDQPWEFADGGDYFWNEGPFVFKEGGKYFLTYSANGYGGTNYGVGLAIATSPLGTYKKYVGNPIVTQDPGKTIGTGHGMMFTDLNGKRWYTFHTYVDLENVAYNKQRVALFARIWFHNGVPTIEYKNW